MCLRRLRVHMLPHSSGPETFLNHHGWLFCSLPKKDDHDNRRRSNPDHVHAFQTATLLVSQPSPMMSAKDPLRANLGQSGLAQSNGAVRAFSLANPLRTRSPPPAEMQNIPRGNDAAFRGEIPPHSSNVRGGLGGCGTWCRRYTKLLPVHGFVRASRGGA